MARMVTRRDASRRKWIAELLMHDLVLILDHTDGKELGGESSNKNGLRPPSRWEQRGAVTADTH